MKKSNLIIYLVFFGLSIRLILALLPGFKIDMTDWLAWAERLSTFNYANFYSKDIFTDYTPGYLYILSLLGFLKNLFVLEEASINIFLKIPAIISELIIGFLIYKEIKENRTKKIATLTLTVILFNPVIIFNSSIWGQVDSILTLFLLGSILFLKKKSLILSSIFFALAFIIKPQAVSIAPMFLLFVIKNLSYINIMKLIWPGIIIILLLAFPFFPNDPVNGLLSRVLETASQYAYTSVNAYNLWGMVGFWISDTTNWNGLTYRTWGYIMLSVYWLIISYYYLKGKLSIYSIAALATMAFFFLPTKVHERYLYPSLIFLIITAFQFRSKILFALITILSMLHLGNLYYVYIYYNKFALNFSNALYFKPLYDTLAQQPVLLSALSTVIFLMISIIIIRLSYEYQKNSH